MKKRLYRKLAALCLAVCILLSGCGIIDLEGYFQELGALLGGYSVPVPFDEMEYTRPDMEKFRAALAEVQQRLEENADTDTLMDSVYLFYESYYGFYTNYMLANIYYCKDLTDLYWEAEYGCCLEAAAEVDAALDQMLYDLADSPRREELEHEDYFGPGFFDGYEGESVWDETFTGLMEQEAALQSRYYELSTQALAETYYSDAYFEKYGCRMGELFVELIALRQQIAAYVGYDDYVSFAYDFYYYRDYTPAQAEGYFAEIQQELVPLYRQLGSSDVWNIGAGASTEQETFDYVRRCAGAMGGTVAQAFELLEDAGLYDISCGENKYDASFSVYLMSYMEPYVFVNPTMGVQDQLTFAHEFGHFCNDYAAYGSVAGVDVAEIFSQGMEYLSLSYADSKAELKKLKMADCLSIYVEQAAYASFEQQAYRLEGDALTAENVYALYERIGKEFGLDIWEWDSRDFVCVTHFFTNPMYVVSYVVSNDAALQLYQLEQAESGAGLTLFEENLATQEQYFLAFLQTAGMESPFAEGHVRSVRETLERVLR